MTSTKSFAVAAAAVTTLMAPAALTAPRVDPPPGRPARTVAEVVELCRASGLQGWDLVDEATALVHRCYAHHSVWHLWEDAGRSLERGRGWSAQYNGALALVLVALGFRVEVVHASRVRGLGRNPWWQAGHSWLWVTHQGRGRDVCASREHHRAGQVSFVPATLVRPMHRWTRTTVSAALTPVVAVQAWRQLFGAPTARWLYRDFDQDL